jgi:hypothetical protein
LHFIYDVFVNVTTLFCLSRCVGIIGNVKELMNNGLLIVAAVIFSMLLYFSVMVTTAAGSAYLHPFLFSLLALLFILCFGAYIYSPTSMRVLLSYARLSTWMYSSRQIELIVEKTIAVFLMLVLRSIVASIAVVLAPMSQDIIPIYSNSEWFFLSNDIAFACIIMGIFVALSYDVEAYVRDFTYQRFNQAPQSIISSPVFFADPLAGILSPQQLAMEAVLKQQMNQAQQMPYNPFAAAPPFSLSMSQPGQGYPTSIAPGGQHYPGSAPPSFPYPPQQ